MELQHFKESLHQDHPPEAVSPLLAAMWWEAHGDWDKAHQIAQDEDNELGSLVHAYLHRQEGDLGNAGYWYRRANRPLFNGTLEEEWEAIVIELL